MKKSEVGAAKKSAKEAEKKRKAETNKKAVETCIGSQNGNSLENDEWTQSLFASQVRH